jgi:lipopolysaccharide export system protein LptA
MWTPKRILMLAGGFVLFFLCYVLYAATSLGRINTLPPLPDQYKPNPGSQPAIVGPRKTSPMEEKMRQAFGIGCRELTWAVRLELNSKSMVMAAEAFEIAKDGRVRLEPLSLALFSKKKNDGRGVEINVLQCNVAYIKFDRPVSSLSEISGRKVEEAELIGNIRIVNNRRTLQRDDDLVVMMDIGPLYYEDKRHLIWTNDHIHLTDGQTNPPSDIRGTGMEMELATSATPAKPGAPMPNKAKGETISGVKRVMLKSDVNMHLYVAGQPGAPPPGDKKPAAPAKPAGQAAAAPPQSEPSHINIRTPGPFRYELRKDHDLAHFDLPAGQGLPSHTPQFVTVDRIHPRLETHDQLQCEHLELRIHRRENAPPPPAGAAPPPQQPAEQGLEIETAHATGKEVVLTSDSEKLYAHGDDFFYDAAKKLAILKGTPHMEADKDDSLIHALELQIQEVQPPPEGGKPVKSYQYVVAKGPGSIHLPNKSTGKKTIHAYWNDKLTSTRDGHHDLLILTGSARFVHEENQQSMQGETLKVWLLPEEKKAEPVAGKPPAGSTPDQSRRPHHLEALGNVLAQSRELNVHDTSRLVVWFKDVPTLPGTPAAAPPRAGPAVDKAPAQPPRNDRPPAPPPAKGVPTPAPTPGRAAVAAPPPPPAAKPTSVMPGLPGANPAANGKSTKDPARPIDLTAKSVEAWVLRSGEKSVLDKLWTEGAVHVRQDPAKPGEKGVNIEGETLQMTCHPDGNELVVTGGDADLAQLLMDKIFILGPEVNIDQRSNKAWVYGNGAMRMESNSSLEGKPLGRTVPLTVHWNKDMLFNGDYAEFRGGIQAVQENAHMACQHLQVFFDRPISLKEGARSDQPAKVRNLVGDQEVRVEDSKILQGRMEKYQLLEGTIITMDTVPREDVPTRADKNNDANEVHLSGPGNVRLMQRGARDMMAGSPRANNGPGAPPEPPVDEEMKLTYVRFAKRMDASSRTNTANFWEDVRVLNFPCDDPYREIDLDAMLASELPPRALYMRCKRLKVLNREDHGKSAQEMEAHGRVEVQAREFWAKADHVYYNEAKDQVVFQADPGNVATLAKVVAKGQEPQMLQGERIIYIRSTGKAWVEGGNKLIGN